jgi:hypothetical protein
MNSLSSFASFEAIEKIKNFSFYEFLKNWKQFHDSELCNQLDPADIEHAFLPNQGQGLFSKEIEEQFELIRIQEDNVDIYIRANQTPNLSKFEHSHLY